MKRTILEIALMIFGFVCFICILCEPGDDMSPKDFIIWELCWWAALLADCLVCRHLDKKHVTNFNEDERA